MEVKRIPSFVMCLHSYNYTYLHLSESQIGNTLPAFCKVLFLDRPSLVFFSQNIVAKLSLTLKE